MFPPGRQWQIDAGATSHTQAAGHQCVRWTAAASYKVTRACCGRTVPPVPRSLLMSRSKFTTWIARITNNVASSVALIVAQRGIPVMRFHLPDDVDDPTEPNSTSSHVTSSFPDSRTNMSELSSPSTHSVRFQHHLPRLQQSVRVPHGQITEYGNLADDALQPPGIHPDFLSC